MADRNRVTAGGIDPVLIGVSFKPNGSSAPTDVRGDATVTYSGTGKYHVQLTSPHYHEYCTLAGVQSADGSLRAAVIEQDAIAGKYMILVTSGTSPHNTSGRVSLFGLASDSGLYGNG